MKAIFAFVFVVLSYNQADAEQVRLIGTARGSESVPTLLERAGCNPLWLSKAMEDSKIDAGKWQQLSRGQRVILKAERCEPTPPEAIAARSREFMQKSVTPRRAALVQGEGGPAAEGSGSSNPSPSQQEPRGGPFHWPSSIPGFILGVIVGAVIMAVAGRPSTKVSASSRMSTGTSPGLGGPKNP